MRKIGILTITGIRDNLRFKTTAIFYFLITIMLLAILTAFLVIFLLAPELNSNKPDRSALELYLGLILYSASVLGLGMYLNSFGYTYMIREKARGNIQSLLATTINIRDIWIGKSMAVFIPGLIFSEILTLACLIAINYIYLVPKIGFLFNPWIFCSSYLFLSLSSS